MNNKNDSDEKTEGVTEEPVTVPDNEKKGSFGIMELDSLIKRYLGDIRKLKDDLKAQKDMFEDTFKNDSKYKESDDKAKAVNREKLAAKQTVMKDPSVTLLAEKVMGIKDEMKDLQEALSGYLREYQRLSGASQFEDDQGNLMEIVHVVKLVKKKE